jgi:hypothetical protein
VVGFIAWFDLMHELLKPGGLLFVTLPDKKYNFDRYRPDTLLSHILNDHLAGHRDLGAEHVMETILYYDRQYIGQAQRPRERLDRKYVLENYRLGHHIGIHCHVFQGETFLPEILNPLIYMGYLQFTVVEFRGSRDNNGEFFVLLRKGSPAGPVDVSGFYSARASEALERLQAPQKEPTETRQVDLRPEEQLQNVQAALARQTLRVAELEMTAGHLDMTLSMIHASRSWKLARLLAAGKQLLSPRTVAKFLWTHAGCPRNSKKTVPGL